MRETRKAIQEATCKVRAEEHFGGRFWVIREEPSSSRDLSEDDEPCEVLHSPAAAILADAFGCAKEKCIKQKRGRKEDLKVISSRLRKEVLRKTSALSADDRSFIINIKTGKGPAVVDGYTPVSSDDDEPDWFQIIGGRPVRIPSRLDD